MKNKVTRSLWQQVERSRQMAILGAVLFVTGVMSIGVMQTTRAANTSNTNVNLTVTAGALAIDAAPSDFQFSSGQPGGTVTGNTGATDGNAIKTNDTRGTSAGYDVTGYFNNNFINSGSTHSAIASQMTWYANQTVIVNVTGADGELVKPGTAETFVGVGAGNPKTLASDSGTGANGAGAYNIHNLKMNYAIPITTPADVYTTKLILTIA